jgi:hypothetical protein
LEREFKLYAYQTSDHKAIVPAERPKDEDATVQAESSRDEGDGHHGEDAGVDIGQREHVIAIKVTVHDADDAGLLLQRLPNTN